MDCGFQFMLINQVWICYYKSDQHKLEEFNCILSCWIKMQNRNSKNLFMESKKLSLKDRGNHIIFIELLFHIKLVHSKAKTQKL